MKGGRNSLYVLLQFATGLVSSLCGDITEIGLRTTWINGITDQCYCSRTGANKVGPENPGL